ncbi:hypothetical protein QLG13_07845 [Rhodococcus aetherivorans]|uniref:hypothetical protein n=1 Tax=Rhodococcus aetherivorans TaxID=191292 RepID=UPI003EBE3D88
MSIRDELVGIIMENSDWSDVLAGSELAADAILARFAVVEFPEPDGEDDDGQTYFDDYEIRVDHTGRHGAEVYLNKRPVHPSWLRARAAEYLAAARDAEDQS